VCLHGVNRNKFRFYLFTEIIKLRGGGGTVWSKMGYDWKKAGRDEIERLKWNVLD
jgi:hypothetical protein